MKRRGYTTDGRYLDSRTHPTKDGTSPQAATGALRVALFRPDSKAICKCRAGECGPEDCDALYITDAAGNHEATFHGRNYRAVDETSEGARVLCVYHVPQTTGDAAIDAAVMKIKMRLSDINARNAEFWKPPADAETEQRRTFVEKPFWQRAPE